MTLGTIAVAFRIVPRGGTVICGCCAAGLLVCYCRPMICFEKIEIGRLAFSG